MSPEGKFVTLENTHRGKEEPIGDWKLKRKIDGKREIVFTFPSDFVLHPLKKVTVGVSTFTKHLIGVLEWG